MPIQKQKCYKRNGWISPVITSHWFKSSFVTVHLPAFGVMKISISALHVVEIKYKLRKKNMVINKHLKTLLSMEFSKFLACFCLLHFQELGFMGMYISIFYNKL